MRTSDRGIEFIKDEEGCVLKTYKCQAGVLTIGIGHTGKDVLPNMIITLERAIELLKLDLRRFEDAVNKIIKVELNQCQFDALVSFAFNVGVNAFSNSTLAKKINAKAPITEIETEFRKWRRGGGKVLPVLVARREREIKLFKEEE